MKHHCTSLYFIIVVLTSIFILGCQEDPVEIIQPNPVPSDYPKILNFSQSRFDDFILQTELFRLEYNVSLNTTDSVLCNANYYSVTGFDITPNSSQPLTSETVADTVRSFLSRWGHLFNVSTETLTLLGVSYNASSEVYFLNYNKNVYHPSQGIYNYGSLKIDITSNGIVQRIDTRCVPTYVIPYNKRISLPQALSSVEGKELLYADWGGSRKIVLSPSILEQAVALPTIIRRENYSSRSLSTYEYRLCWKFTFPVFNVYVDAITGEDIDYAEQYVIF